MCLISRMLLKDEKNFLKLDNLAKTAIFIFIKNYLVPIKGEKYG